MQIIISNKYTKDTIKWRQKGVKVSESMACVNGMFKAQDTKTQKARLRCGVKSLTVA